LRACKIAQCRDGIHANSPDEDADLRKNDVAEALLLIDASMLEKARVRHSDNEAKLRKALCVTS